MDDDCDTKKTRELMVFKTIISHFKKSAQLENKIEILSECQSEQKHIIETLIKKEKLLEHKINKLELACQNIKNKQLKQIVLAPISPTKTNTTNIKSADRFQSKTFNSFGQFKPTHKKRTQNHTALFEKQSIEDSIALDIAVQENTYGRDNFGDNKDDYDGDDFSDNEDRDDRY
ncbi:hypothetical protein [Pelagibaculum spongiae]|uniref:Uncharacterized protein n=1 Tax=Pelagibaculum spongiae TaxID=2080658 RepID=A0A2V1GR61_9GAMM|nr:hypothetical protein [Pelagibaculum spongiae]PVZ64894.1 hypothetical protein DC094_18690 [Pelagibaculum spongiae]